mmetsp:Transcript_3297/g.5629  ORF Transcript_3297/g.5629 Transcript_3297/m.5629 type:complete len:272 (-) Transcript_3297:15-830(-)
MGAIGLLTPISSELVLSWCASTCPPRLSIANHSGGYIPFPSSFRRSIRSSNQCWTGEHSCTFWNLHRGCARHEFLLALALLGALVALVLLAWLLHDTLHALLTKSHMIVDLRVVSCVGEALPASPGVATVVTGRACSTCCGIVTCGDQGGVGTTGEKPPLGLAGSMRSLHVIVASFGQCVARGFGQALSTGPLGAGASFGQASNALPDQIIICAAAAALLGGPVLAGAPFFRTGGRAHSHDHKCKHEQCCHLCGLCGNNFECHHDVGSVCW